MWRLVEDAPRLMALCREAGIPCDDLQEAPAKDNASAPPNGC